jgi:superfamily I DNA/RNA helicase
MEKDWSSQQQDIFTFCKKGHGNALVRARAGCAKTTTIIKGVEYAPERNILCCAFNKEIAEELSRRLTNPNATARTLHSVGNGFIFKNWGKVQIEPTRGKRLAVAAGRQILKINPPKEIVTLIANLASKLKNMHPFITSKLESDVQIAEGVALDFNLTPDQEQSEAGWSLDVIIDAAIRAMTLAQEKDGTIDYDDMIYLPVVCRWAHPRYDLVIVDEAQDMNTAQLLLAQRIARGRIIVVGDNLQAIYGFRGADSNALDRLKTELNAREFGLTVTYRCPKQIVELARCVAPDFQAHPSAPEGIIDCIRVDALYEIATPGCFILSRKNAPLAKICLRLVRNGRRAIIRGREIGDQLINIIRKLDDRTMKGFFTDLKIWEEKMIQSLRDQDEDANESRMETVADNAATIRVLAEGLATVAELVTRIQQFFIADKDSDQIFGRAITLSSVHKAKGLEADRVFLLEETFNSPKGTDDKRNREEDSIWYVAVTRAKAHLTWVTGITKE